MCGYGYGVQNADPQLYRNPYHGIMGLYGYEVEIFNFLVLVLLFNFIIILYTTWGGKAATCERLYIFPVCAQTICFCLVWPLTSEPCFFALLSPCHSLSLSVAVTATLLPFVTTLCLGTTAVTALARRSNKREGLPCHRLSTPSSLTGGGEGGRQGRGMRRSETK